MLPIAVDAMGGDLAPEVTVAGAARAARELGCSLALVGEEETIRRELRRYPGTDGLAVVHAAETIGMEESPAAAIRKKRNSSIMVATELVSRGEAAAVVSAGNSGAAIGAALVRLGMIGEVERPAIATVMPAVGGQVVLLDAGATVDCRPRNLVEFALMGSIYARRVLEVESPRVALLSIGEEASKGNALTKAAHEMLSGEAQVNFVGNIEGNHVMSGGVDVVVCEGFVGNVVLKVAEGVAESFRRALRQEVASAGPAGWLTQLTLGRRLKRFRDVLDYAKYGGALLLGVNGVCVISHGRSGAEAVLNAIRVAKESVERGMVEGISASIREASPRRQPAGGRGAGES
jgi:glycerol-3-phosphate acyltransferase PlsX